MNTNLMQHKSVLFLISLSQNKIHEIEEKGVDYKLFIKTIRSYSHVEVHETISEELINTASLYDVVVIVGHQVDGCIEMEDGSLFPMVKIASALHHYTGYIHVAVCGSSVIRDAIKQGSPDSRLRTSKQSTQLELQLLIYSLLFSRTDLNKDTFDYWYDFEWNHVKEIQDRKDPADLEKLPCATKLGTMATSERPFEVKRNSSFYIRVIFHDESAEETKRNNIKDARNIPYRIKEPILNELKEDDVIHLDLRFDTCNPEMIKFLKGEGEYSFPYKKDAENRGEFKCFVEAGFTEENFHGSLTIKINDNPNPVDIWSFLIEVKRYENDLSVDDINNELSGNRLHNTNGSPFKFTVIPRAYPLTNTSKEEVNTNTDDEKIVEQLLLKEIFKTEVDARDFIHFCRSHHDKPVNITLKVKLLVKEKIIVERNKGRRLWTILYENKLYRYKEANWNKQLI